jgi:hypothetical protein
MAAIVYENLADAAEVSASSWIAAAPPERLQNHHTTRRWKGRNGDTEFITAAFAAAQQVDFVALLRCAGVFDGEQRALSAAAFSRVRIASGTDPLLGDLFDNTSAAGRISEDYGALIALMPTPVSARSLRIDLSEAGAAALLAGRLVVGLRSTFALNFSYGWSFGYADLSRKRKSAAGLTYVEHDDRYRVLNLTFDMEEADRYNIVHEVDRLNGWSRDLMMVIDHESSNLARDCVWGLANDLSPPTQPNPIFFSKQFSIEERL